MTIDWDDAYANGKYIEDAASYPDRWASDAAAFRDAMKAENRFEGDLAYGPAARNRVDLFMPQSPPAGLAVFVHGGYWQKFDKSLWSHLATGALGHGWAVALPSYTLAPDAPVATITSEIASCITMLAERIDGPIRLAGHSAGGHLVTRMMCSDSALGESVRARIAHVLSISGVHDLRPLLRAPSVNTALQLDAEAAKAESPCLLEPLETIAMTAWVGEDERPEFVRQSALLANIWSGFETPTRYVGVPGRHHFDVIADLTDPNAPITGAFIGADGWPA